jgi:hypothetical protein
MCVHLNPASAASISPPRCCGEATPQPVKFSLPLLAFTCASSSAKVLAGKLGCTPIITGVLVTSTTGARSFSVS